MQLSICILYKHVTSFGFVFNRNLFIAEVREFLAEAAYTGIQKLSP